MIVYKINNNNPDIRLIKRATHVLKQGGLIVYPTDTAYGLGGNALDVDVVKNIYKLKHRSTNKPTHVLVRDWNMISKYCKTNIKAERLYSNFMPGPLTIVLLKKKNVPNILTGGLPTLGIRIPNNEVTKYLSAEVSFPYTTPSANIEGELTPYSIKDVKKVLDVKKVNLVLDAGVLSPIPPSTIVNLTVDPPNLIREGSIKGKQILRVLG